MRDLFADVGLDDTNGSSSGADAHQPDHNQPSSARPRKLTRRARKEIRVKLTPSRDKLQKKEQKRGA